MKKSVGIGLGIGGIIGSLVLIGVAILNKEDPTQYAELRNNEDYLVENEEEIEIQEDIKVESNDEIEA